MGKGRAKGKLNDPGESSVTRWVFQNFTKNNILPFTYLNEILPYGLKIWSSGLLTS